MTKVAAQVITSVLVPYFSRQGRYQKVEEYRVTRIQGGYIVQGPRGSYHITQHPDNYLVCPCEGYGYSIERNGDDEIPAFCRHLVCIAWAQVEVTEIRQEALYRELDQFMDPFVVAA